jgi:hypothetical protein
MVKSGYRLVSSVHNTWGIRAREDTNRGVEQTLKRYSRGSGEGCSEGDVMSEEESQEPRRVERKLLIRVIPAEMLSEPELDLGDDIEERYLSDWLPTSHTYIMLPNGNGLLTVLMERIR